jgi:hypothetical protein
MCPDVSVHASARGRCMMEPIKFASEMQHAPLEIGDHRVAIRTINLSVGNFFFKRFLSRLQVLFLIYCGARGV